MATFGPGFTQIFRLVFNSVSNFLRVGLANVHSSSYDELETVESHAVITGDAQYNFIPSNFREFTAFTGSVGVSDSMFQLSTGTTVYGYAAVQSFRTLNYKTAQGCSFRFGAIFESNAAETISGAGAVALGDEVGFGYKGTSFGVWHRYGGLAEKRLLTITSPAGGSETATVTINGVAYNIPITVGTVQHNAYEIASYLEANGSGIYSSQNDDGVYISFTSDGAKSGVYSFSSATATAAFSTISTGTTKTSEHTALENFNGTVFTGFNPSKGNEYKIKYTDGFSNIDFYILNPTKSFYELAHSIQWANSKTEHNLGNPSLRCGAYVASEGGTTDITIKVPYFGAFVHGTIEKTRNPRGYENTKNIGTTATNIFTIRNKRIYNDRYNQVELEPIFLTLANDGAKSAIFEIVTNATIGGETNYQDVGTNLISEVDTAGTTVTNGRRITPFTVAKGQSVNINLNDFNIRVPPTLEITISGRMASGSASDLTAALTWYEDV